MPRRTATVRRRRILDCITRVLDHERVIAVQTDMSDSSPIILTERAATKVRELRDDEGNPKGRIRESHFVFGLFGFGG